MRRLSVFRVDGLENEYWASARPLLISGPFGTGYALRKACNGAGADRRVAIDGTSSCADEGCLSWRPSAEPKKNVPFLMSLPPITPPKSFCRRAARRRPDLFRNQSFASNVSFLK